MKKLFVILGILVVLAVIGALVLFANLDSIIKSGVEGVGSEATQSDVTVENVELSVSSGQGAIRNLKIGNPDGFATDSAMRLGTISISLDTSTLNSDIVVVKEVLIDGPEITYEISGALGTESNIGRIRENVDAFVKKYAGESGGSEGGGGGGGGESAGGDGGKKIVIERLRIENGRIGVSATFLGGKEVTASMPAIDLKDLGKDEGGLTAEEVAAKVLRELTGGVESVVKKLDLAGLAEGIGKGAKDLVEGVGEGVGDAVKGAGDALKGVFGK